MNHSVTALRLNLNVIGYRRLAAIVAKSCVRDAHFALSRAALIKVKGFVRITKAGKPVVVRKHARYRPDSPRQEVFNQEQRLKSFVQELNKTKIYPKSVEPKLSKTDLFGNKFTDSAHKDINSAIIDVYEKGARANRFGEPQEFAYLMDRKTGAYFASIKGKADHVVIPRTDNTKDLLIIHNHPNNSSLSLPDFLTGSKEGKAYTIAVDKSGNIYSGHKVADVSAATLETVYNDEYLAAYYQVQYALGRLPKNQKALSMNDSIFLATHTANTQLQKRGMVHYKAQLDSPYHQKLWGVWQTMKNKLGYE